MDLRLVPRPELPARELYRHANSLQSLSQIVDNGNSVTPSPQTEKIPPKNTYNEDPPGMVTLFSAAHSQIGTSKAETLFFLMEKVQRNQRDQFRTERSSKECTVCVVCRCVWLHDFLRVTEGRTRFPQSC